MTHMDCEPAGGPVWKIPLRICSYDVDVTRSATIPAICRYFLEAAWCHAEQLGFGYSHLAQLEKAWVLSRLLLKIHQLPGWGDTVRIETWPRGIQGLFALRDFKLADAEGELLVAGTSAWLVLNVKTRRPQRLDFLAASMGGLPPKRAIGKDPEKLIKADGLSPGIEIKVRASDIDVNGHVGSARYLDWILDTYPDEFRSAHMLEELEVNYLNETKAGEILTATARYDQEHIWIHSLSKGAAEVCRARARWIGRPTC